MEFLTIIMPLFTAIIAFCSVFGALGLLFRILLNPVKEGIHNLKTGVKKIEREDRSIKRIECKDRSIKRIEREDGSINSKAGLNLLFKPS